MLPNFGLHLLSRFVRSGTSMHTTNDAHKYLREPPTVKSFHMKSSTVTNRKNRRRCFSMENGSTGLRMKIEWN
jgi:hypothetical protein